MYIHGEIGGAIVDFLEITAGGAFQFPGDIVSLGAPAKIGWVHLKCRAFCRPIAPFLFGSVSFIQGPGSGK